MVDTIIGIVEALNTAYYAAATIFCIYTAFAYRNLRAPMAALALHLGIVSIRAGLRQVFPETVLWDWSEVHNCTMFITFLCVIFRRHL